MRMISLANGGDFFLKHLGFVPGLPLCRTRTIWYDDYLRINANQTRITHELHTNWYDAVRCNKMQHDGDTMQYEAVRWWRRINTIGLWCDENTIGTINRNLHEPMRSCASPIWQCDRWASYCNVLSRSRQAANPSANVQRIDTNVQRWDTNQ